MQDSVPSAASQGRVEAIWIKRMRLGPMDPVDRARLIAGRGIVGNANQGGRRQVTIIDWETWDAIMARLGVKLSPSTRRANVMVSGISLAHCRGCTLLIGDCRIRICGETRPCERMDEALRGLRQAMRAAWGGGAFGEVLDHGEIAVGDPVRWVEHPPRW